MPDMGEKRVEGQRERELEARTFNTLTTGEFRSQRTRKTKGQ